MNLAALRVAPNDPSLAHGLAARHLTQEQDEFVKTLSRLRRAGPRSALKQIRQGALHPIALHVDREKGPKIAWRALVGKPSHEGVEFALVFGDSVGIIAAPLLKVTKHCLARIAQRTTGNLPAAENVARLYAAQLLFAGRDWRGERLDGPLGSMLLEWSDDSAVAKTWLDASTALDPAIRAACKGGAV